MRSTRPLLLASAVLCASHAPAFSQRTPVTAVGHEWLTVNGAAAAVKESSADAARLAGRGNWAGSGCEQGCPGHQYEADNYLVWSTTLGQRWVDLGGFTVENQGRRTCWDALTQSPDDLQYDHFLRARDDAGPAGGLEAMRESVRRFRRYFLAAVAEKGGVPLRFMDGGATSAEFTADRAYFLFGREVHLFQDSFSLEHAVRKSSDGFSRLQGIKSYVCTTGSPQHGHSPPGNVSTLAGFDATKPTRSLAQLGGWGSDPNDYEKNGDVLWKSASGSWGVDNVKPHGRAALAAMKDLWLAFERARARKVPAEAAADELIAKWLTIEGTGGDAVAFDKKACAKEAALKSDRAVEELRKRCLGITGKNPDDPKRPPYTWSALTADWPDADLLEQAAEFAGDAAGAAGAAAKDVGAATKEAAEDVADATEDAVDDAKDVGAATVAGAKKKAKSTKKKAKKALKKVGDTVKDVFD